MKKFLTFSLFGSLVCGSLPCMGMITTTKSPEGTEEFEQPHKRKESKGYSEFLGEYAPLSKNPQKYSIYLFSLDDYWNHGSDPFIDDVEGTYRKGRPLYEKGVENALTAEKNACKELSHTKVYGCIVPDVSEREKGMGLDTDLFHTFVLMPRFSGEGAVESISSEGVDGRQMSFFGIFEFFSEGKKETVSGLFQYCFSPKSPVCFHHLFKPLGHLNRESGKLMEAVKSLIVKKKDKLRALLREDRGYEKCLRTIEWKIAERKECEKFRDEFIKDLEKNGSGAVLGFFASLDKKSVGFVRIIDFLVGEKKKEFRRLLGAGGYGGCLKILREKIDQKESEELLDGFMEDLEKRVPGAVSGFFAFLDKKSVGFLVRIGFLMEESKQKLQQLLQQNGEQSLSLKSLREALRNKIENKETEAFLLKNGKL